MKIYVASSWRNSMQPIVVNALRDKFDVYDFRHPEPGNTGFRWTDCDPEWHNWEPRRFREMVLTHPIAAKGFRLDMTALQSCDICVLVMPSGRSAHLEAGYAVGAGKPTCILLADGEPELMYRMVDRMCLSTLDVVEWCEEQAERRRCFGESLTDCRLK